MINRSRGVHQPRMSDEGAERLRAYHEGATAWQHRRGEVRLAFLGRNLVVPESVYAPSPVSEILGKAVLAEVTPSDRVLDMGTGCGVHAILAASVAREVIGVDINPYAVESARANAARNEVTARTTFLQGDVFESVTEVFDVIVFNPPFRWFEPRDLLDRSMADENYGALTRFVTQASAHLSDKGRILMFFGTSGDIQYLYDLVDGAGLGREIVASRESIQGGLTLVYYVIRLSRIGHSPHS